MPTVPVDFDNVTGGYEKQIVIQPYPERLTAVDMTLEDVAGKISMNTENVGGGLIELGGEQVVIRGDNRVATIEEIAKLPLRMQTATTKNARNT